MLKKLLKNTKFQSIIKDFYNENKEIVIDIILFGSVVKGKEKPKDIDFLVITIKKVDSSLLYSLRKSLEKIGLKASITHINYQGLFNPSFLAREAFIAEGYSLIMKKFISIGLGFSNFYMFKYNLKGFNKSERMKFYYSLYGRNKSEGMLKILNAIKFSRSIILVPVEKVEETREYLNNLNIKYIEIPVLIPLRITKSELFKK